MSISEKGRERKDMKREVDTSGRAGNRKLGKLKGERREENV